MDTPKSTNRDKITSGSFERLMTEKEVRAILRIGRTTAYRWRKAGILLPVYVGSIKRYRPEDIRELVTDGKGQPS
jgi:predicted site-specific integrase-resolvase